jgi:hypothetical protein
MSERARTASGGVALPRLVAFDSGHRVLPSRVDGGVHGGPASGVAGVGAGVCSDGGRNPGGDSRDAGSVGSGIRSPQWYRQCVLLASGGSAGAIAIVAVVKSVMG